MAVESQKLIHPSPAEDKRFLGRRPIYRGDGISCKIAFADQIQEVEILDISPEGLSAIYKDDSLQLLPGQIYNLHLQVHQGQYFQLQAELRYQTKMELRERACTKLGFQFVQSKRSHTKEELRFNHRFTVNDFFPPTAVCYNPFFFNESIFFRVANFSAGGMLLYSSLSVRTLIPGQVLELQIHIPAQTVQSMTCRVIYVSTETDHLRVGVTFEGNTAEIHQAISEYLFAVTDFSIKDLRTAGLKVGGINRGLLFTYPQSPQDWQEVKLLRLRAYHQVGKFTHITDPDKMIDEFDAYARNIICKVKGKVIASGRVIFINGDLQRSEHIRLGLNVPEWIWKEPVCEFSRACTDMENRGSDLFFSLLQHFGRLAYQGGCRYVLANCNGDLWPLYRSVGFKKLGVTFEAFGRKDCHLIYVDVHKMMAGKVGSFTYWNQVVYPIAHFLHRQSSKELLSRLRQLLHSWAFPYLRRLRLHKKTSSPKS